MSAGDEEHQSDAPNQHPQAPVHVANNLLFQRPEVWPDSSIFQGFWAEAHWHRKTLFDDWKHPRHVRVGFGQRDSRLKPGDGFIAEISEESVSAVELQGKKHSDFPSAEVEIRRQHANNLPQFSVDTDCFSNHGAIAAELALPKAETQHHGLCAARGIIGARERAS